MIYPHQVVYKQIIDAVIEVPGELPVVPPEVYEARLRQVWSEMSRRGFDVLVVYADREHCANFDYVVGFEPRFEEGLLVLRPGVSSVALLGNENLSMVETSPLKVEGMLYQTLSLPNQPMDKNDTLPDLLKEAGVKKGDRVGVVGWKLFTQAHGSNPETMFDVPAFILEGILAVTGEDNVLNATPMFNDPGSGLRTVCEVPQIAVMEYGAAWASTGVNNLLKKLKPGLSESELAVELNARGVPYSCHPMVSTGRKARWGLLSPSSRRVSLGDSFTTALGIIGGLTSRAGYVAYSVNDLPPDVSDYVEVVAKPFYAAVTSWYEAVGIGVEGGHLFDVVNTVFPKDQFGWILNPGHLIHTDEWLSSPIYPQSTIKLRNGQALQMDVIPAPAAPYYGSNVEDGIVLANTKTQEELQSQYPDVWGRIQKRRQFMTNELGIHLKPEVLPMSNIPGLLRPLLLNHEMGLGVER